MAGADHWDERYGSIGATAVSWYEPEPTVSLELLDRLGVEAADSVIDVGGGASTLVDHLLARDHHDLTVLDLSGAALATSRLRVHDASAVTWIEHDLLTWQPPRTWAVWHDRAVLHFLVDDADRAAYASRLLQAVEPGGAFVIGVFAEDGPEQCSALPVRRHSADDLVELVERAGAVEVVEQRRHVHHTPGGADQPFRWIAGRLLAPS